MQPHIAIITLGVDDLARATRFYRDGLGWPTKGIIGEAFEHGAACFFRLSGGLLLALWPRASLAHDSGLPLDGPSPTNCCLAHNVAAPDEVEQVLERAETAGGKVIKPAGETFYGGRAGYFQDTEGHLWEVAYNPGLADLG